MRRYGVFIFVLVIIFSFYRMGHRNQDRPGQIEVRAMITDIVKKKRVTNYYLGNIFVSDFSNKDRNLHIGDKVLVYGESKDLDNLYINDFNYGRHLRSKGVFTYIEASKIVIYGRSNLYYNIGRLRTYCIEANKYMYKSEGDILNALVLGYKNDLDKNIVDTFRDSGLSHVMSISGLHIAILLGIIIVFIGRINRLYKIFIVFSVLLFYNILVGGGPSISRAIGISFLASLAYFFDRKVDIINILAFIASIMLILNPYIMFNISFELSFLAVLSMAIYTKYLKKYIYFDFLNTFISANILTIPLVLYRFKTVSTVGVVGNILVLPLIGIVIFLDLISLIGFYISIDLGLLLSYINKAIIGPVYFILEKIANYGSYNFDIRSMSPILLAVYYTGAIGLAILLELYYIKKNKTN